MNPDDGEDVTTYPTGTLTVSQGASCDQITFDDGLSKVGSVVWTVNGNTATLTPTDERDASGQGDNYLNGTITLDASGNSAMYHDSWTYTFAATAGGLTTATTGDNGTWTRAQ